MLWVFQISRHFLNKTLKPLNIRFSFFFFLEWPLCLVHQQDFLNGLIKIWFGRYSSHPLQRCFDNPLLKFCLNSLSSYVTVVYPNMQCLCYKIACNKLSRGSSGRVKEKGGRRGSCKCRLRCAGKTMACPDKHLSPKVISQSWRLSVDTLAFV